MRDDISRHVRVLTVLEQLASTQYPQTLGQLSQRTGFPKSTLTRVLQSLERSAYVTRLPGELGYTPGPRANRLGLSLLKAPQFLRASRAVLGRLVAITGEACNLTAPAGDCVQYLARVESDQPMRLQLHMEIGAHVPLHCTASGKLFLAMAHESERERILQCITLDRLTPRSIVDRERLEAELRRIRAQGLGVDDEEFIQGMVAIAVPVKEAKGGVIAAVACHAPTAQKSLRQLLDFTEPMKQAARDMAAVFRDCAR